MDDERVEILYAKADNLLSKATEELHKPEEDVVTYSACISARSSLYHFLGCLYVHKSNEEIDKTLEQGKKTIDELIEYATQHVSGVGEIDFSPMRCTCKDVKEIVNDEEIYFCNNINIVKECTHLAQKVKDIIVSDAFGGQAPGDKSVAG
ncbi:hypothetical protein [Fodinibius sediminis]|uniref:HEPN domain-containing protein n=1 Tax=Fodinibius sediminis TaxID=1214077 RepID=A0A521CYK5_9BACT|nr:hypothetical protein [Fodinibius sediminis]SMO64502.1 hypothetical protein SAMN06265218_10814 [Fodinibius sediminis]